MLAGNEWLLKEHQVELRCGAGQAAAGYMEKGATVIYVAAQGKLQGVLALADTLREESAQMIRDLSAVGVEPVASHRRP